MAEVIPLLVLQWPGELPPRAPSQVLTPCRHMLEEEVEVEEEVETD